MNVINRYWHALVVAIVIAPTFLVPQTAHAALACPLPRTYSIGAIDSRFGIATTSLVADLAGAEAIWEKPTGRNIFAFATSGGEITINLKYDTRQDSITSVRMREKKLDAIETVLKLVQAKYKIIVDENNADISKNVARFTSYAQDMNAFNGDVVRVNSAGGMSQSQYQVFQKRKDALDATFSELKATEDRLNAKITSLNNLATSLNSLVGILNAYVKDLNAEVVKLGEFEEGYYQRIDSVESIGIYAFNDESQLTRVLAHEMGHSLGLDHVPQEDAVMYSVNKGTKLEATVADLNELKRVCP